jgi:hypothetical protein
MMHFATLTLLLSYVFVIIEYETKMEKENLIMHNFLTSCLSALIWYFGKFSNKLETESPRIVDIKLHIYHIITETNLETKPFFINHIHHI